MATKAEMKKLEKLFNKRKKLAKEKLAVALEFDRLSDEIFGIAMNETDDDRIIDTLDYGIDSLPFPEFVERMNHYQKDIRIPYDYANKDK